jgi:hypothetical protein
MKIIKQMETTLNLHGADIYNLDVDFVCIKLLTDKYVGKNFMSCHVTEVLRIIRKSDRYMTQMMDGSCSIDVQFEVRAIVFTRGEIIHGCKVVEKDSDGAIRFATSVTAAIMVDRDYAGVCNVDDVIPTIVNQVRYALNTSEVTLSVTPFEPNFDDPVVYKVTSSDFPAADHPSVCAERETSDDFDEKSVDVTGVRIAELETALDAGDKKTIKFFANLMYPYKKMVKIPKALKFIDLADISNLKKGFVVIPKGMDMGRKGAYHFDDVDTATAMGIIIEQSAESIQSAISMEVLDYLEGLNGLRETYPTTKESRKYVAVWRHFLSRKR